MASPSPLNCLFATIKHPDESIHLTLDFRQWIAPRDALSSAAWSTADPEITIDSSEFTSAEASVEAHMTGAVDDDQFTLKCLAVTQLGLTEVRRVELRVREADYPTRTQRDWYRLKGPP